MSSLKITLRTEKEFEEQDVLELYKSVEWSSADKPELLIPGLKNSHHLILAYHNDELVGLGNALSDGFLVVYYPHLLIKPNYQGFGIGYMIMEKFQEKYKDFHQQILVAVAESVPFYEKCGFTKAGSTLSMWKYKGADH